MNPISWGDVLLWSSYRSEREQRRRERIKRWTERIEAFLISAGVHFVLAYLIVRFC